MLLTPEQLEEQIKLTFSEEVIIPDPNRGEMWSNDDRGRPRLRQDSYEMAKARFRWLNVQWSHGAVNLPKEFMIDKLRWKEETADWAKYPATFALLFLIVYGLPLLVVCNLERIVTAVQQVASFFF